VKLMRWIAKYFFATLVAIAAPDQKSRAQDAAPAWAYPWDPSFKASTDDGIARRVPDSALALTLPQTRDFYFAPDWHPDDHPPMPRIVSGGRKPDVFACGFCHRADGPGGPENSSLAGLPASYIVRQMQEFRDGTRKTSTPERGPFKAMVRVAKNVTDDEIMAAALYFSALKPRHVINVIETEMVPKTYVAGSFLTVSLGGEKEPLGRRIIEVPEDIDQFEHRDSHARFVAYVPVGSIKAGQKLVTTGIGNEATSQCQACHGPDLRGLAEVPGIAGRSPSYIVRQLYDFKHGTRNPNSMMAPGAQKMTTDDMIALASYAASLSP
jgi:cytochrome c553